MFNNINQNKNFLHQIYTRGKHILQKKELICLHVILHIKKTNKNEKKFFLWNRVFTALDLKYSSQFLAVLAYT